jgi:hypothetical protein
VCVLATVGCSGDDDPDGVVEEDPLGLGERGPGTCLDFDDEVGAEITSLPVVPCTVSHSHEIYAVEDHPADVYPGFGELEDFAQRVCLAAFEPYVGANPFDSSLFHTWLVPTLDGWNDEDDREIVCVLGSHDAEPLVRSMRGSGV